jgi:acetyl-CoA carboxylase biotin carboxyl carrier protein
MEDNSTSPTDPFDTQKIHYLVRLMKRYDLTELDLQNGQARVRLRRRGPEPASPPVGPAQPTIGPGVLPPTAGPASPPAPAEPAAPAAPKTLIIESPMVGTFYTSSAPNAPPFVTTGSVVHPETIVGIIEAMKVFTEIPAGVSGTIVEILAKNGQPVEFGQPLFRVLPS